MAMRDAGVGWGLQDSMAAAEWAERLPEADRSDFMLAVLMGGYLAGDSLDTVSAANLSMRIPSRTGSVKALLLMVSKMMVGKNLEGKGDKP